MNDRPYKPGPSKIHGLGVIATRLIRAGERIHVDLGPEFHGFNHSCAPTLGRLYGVGQSYRTYAPYRFALRDIEPGSELTIDYRIWQFNKRFRFEFICNCPKCRKENA